MLITKKALLAAGLLAGAAAMTGCTANTTPVSTPTPQTQKVTAQPATAQPEAAQPETQSNSQSSMDAGMEASGEEEPAPLKLSVEGKETEAGAVMEEGKLLLPLVETAQALGWKSSSEQSEEDTQQKRIMMLDKEDSRITVSWTVSDNTAKGITWQKDGLLIPVDTMITTIDDVVYVPAAFFEEAMDVTVSRTQEGASVESKEPKNTPETDAQES